MAKVSLFKQDGTQAGEVTLNDAVFGIEPNETVVFDVVLSQRASLRQGTHAHKTVHSYLVAVKPWRQKELDVPVKVQSAHHNSVVVVLSSVLTHVAMLINFHKKYVSWLLNQLTHKSYRQHTLGC